MLQRRQGEARSPRAWAGRLLALLLCAAALIPARAGFAQAGGPTVTLAGFSAEGWSAAQAVVTALDGEGRPVSGLSEADFQAQVNQTAVPVTSLTQGVDNTLPIAVVLALDVSGSMEGAALEQAKAAARGFLDQLGPRDTVAVLTFADTVAVVGNSTQGRDAVVAAIDGLTAKGATALYQATADSARLASEASTSRRAVVLLSDGLDHGSALPRDQALAAAQAAGVPVFAIGLGTDIDRAYLSELATKTGGQFGETPSPEGLTQLYRDVGELLRGQYVLTLDASQLDLANSEPATLRVSATAGGASGSDERLVCVEALCVALRAVQPGEHLQEARTVTADVVSAGPVTSVAFSVDGETLEELTGPPYRYTLDPTAFTDGGHTLAVKVATGSGETAASEVAVRIGAAGGSGTSLLALAPLAIAGVIGVLFLLLYLRRRRPKDEGPQPAPAPEAPRPAPRGGWPGRLLTRDEPPPPPAAPEIALGRLLCTDGLLAGQTFAVGQTPIGIGIGDRCLVKLPEELDGGVDAGPEHARVWIREEQLMVHEVRRLTALGPVGGRWEILSSGEAFSIGSCTFRFDLDTAQTLEEVPNALRTQPEAANGADQQPQPVAAEAPSAPPAPPQPAPAPEPAKDWPDGVPNILRDRPASSNESEQPDEQPQELPTILRAPVAPSDEGEQPGEQAVEPPIILRGQPNPPPDDDEEQPEEAPPDIPNIFRDPEALSPGGAPDKRIVWSPQADETWEESA